MAPSIQFHSKACCCIVCRSRGRHGTKYTEEMEDQALLADEDTGGERAGHRLMAQPSVIKGGQMREYQMQGLNWLIHLYDNGINGILADEMVCLPAMLAACLQQILCLQVSSVAFCFKKLGCIIREAVLPPRRP